MRPALFSLLAGLLCLAGGAFAKSPAAELPAPGQWRQSCDGQQHCAVEQFGMTEDNKPVLRLRFENQQEGRARISALAPLGISLRAGLDLVVDNAAPIKLPFERCLPQGCEVSAILDQAALGNFLKGTTLTVRYAPNDALTASVPFKLEGLAAALSALPR